MSTYLTIKGYKALSTIPDGFVDEVEERYPGWVAGQLEAWSRWIDSRLRKRYASPFAAWDDSPPTPLSVQVWLTRIVNLQVWIKRGVDPNDLQFEEVRADRDEAKAEVLEAANANEGWFDIPLRADADGTAIARRPSRSYSEASPYVFTDIQDIAGSNEDQNGSGSFG